MLEAIRSVQGWLYDDEALTLFDSVQKRAGHRMPCVVVEIGSWKGKSAIALALALGSTSAGIVFAIDPHTGSSEHRKAGAAIDTFAEFLSNIQNARVADRVRPLRMTSYEARRLFEDRSVDMLYVDGSHVYEDVRRDIEDWTPTLRPGSIVAFNDVFWPGVYKALNEGVTRVGSAFRSA